MKIAEYGKVYFFTRTVGSSAMGATVVTEGVGGELDGYRIRYIHLGAPHPSLRVGDVIEPGREIGVMGSTAIMESWPHLHFDLSDPDGRRVDPRPYIDRVNVRGRSVEVYCSREVKSARDGVLEGVVLGAAATPRERVDPKK